MKLSERVLEELAPMVVGDAKQFPYRSSHFITRFFARCGLPLFMTEQRVQNGPKNASPN